MGEPGSWVQDSRPLERTASETKFQQVLPINEPRNLQTAAQTCNRRKAPKMGRQHAVSEFRTVRKHPENNPKQTMQSLFKTIESFHLEGIPGFLKVVRDFFSHAEDLEQQGRLRELSWKEFRSAMIELSSAEYPRIA